MAEMGPEPAGGNRRKLLVMSTNISWTQQEAIILATQIETVCPDFGYHVALTGGCLYRNGHRQDLDLLFYRIRQIENPDYVGLLSKLAEIGIHVYQDFGFCLKAGLGPKSVDLLFPECPGGDYQDSPSQMEGIQP